MAKKLKVGFVGLGSIARNAHFPGWAEVQEAEIVAGADISKVARDATAQALDLDDEMLFEDYEEMINSVDLDIVDVCTPQKLHVDPTVMAFNAGCDVIVEKPAATSAENVQKMIDAGKDAGKLLMVAQSMRYSPEPLALKRWVDEGLVGDIYWARASYLRSRGVPGRPSFILDELSAGGPCYDLGVHILDLCLYLMGHPEPATVSANVWVEISDKPSVMTHDPDMFQVPDELAAAFIRFANGACISLETSWALNMSGGSSHSVFLAGTEGGIQTNPATLTREEAGMLTDTTVQVNPDEGRRAHTQEIVAFVDAVVNDKPSPVPGEDALLTQRILDGIYESARLGKEVGV
ncbi:MAG: Gfo/Idh/MocA family oxidoreductase [Armatimonadota bacterium]